ncbi:hypothetical protein H6P81_015460 [Aristolochia fimbriata]|uniref:J domain-containing protein n=1 Tax=Aristolochia fimbriata TaxID=158543 RepID=A0AAV7E5L1_ARIFI|nr:hypothetical protein H6P81_015460 [Aristolochia fimbriata]
MGVDSYSKYSRSKNRHDVSASSGSDSDTHDRRSRRRNKSKSRSHHKSRRDSDSDGKSQKRKSRRDRKERRTREYKKSHREHRKRVPESDASSSSCEDMTAASHKPESVLQYILKKFPSVVNELQQLLQMIDDGQAVDTRGISDRPLRKLLKKLFQALDLNEPDAGVFLLPQTASRSMEILGPVLSLHLRPEEQRDSANHLEPSSAENGMEMNDDDAREGVHVDEPPSSKRRIIGPAMPSSELLAAAAKLTEAESELREAELDVENDLFIGPPPPAIVAEAETANEAERFEEVTRIMECEADSPYDVLGVNHKMAVDNIKKRYWKLSLMVHPDKCSHPQAHQAFIILNKAFKELQDPEKKKATDDKIREKEEREAFKAELQAQREAAQWRRLQGISMEGDDELLAEPEPPPKREEWMTTLPPERKAGVSMHSVKSFSRAGKEGRGDTSAWTDSPLDKTLKAKMNYIEAYDRAREIAAADSRPLSSSDADLVDKYNKSKRSKSLVQRHHEEASSKKRKKNIEPEKQEEWVGQHPWKPWDREKDLVGGRQRVNFDSNGMAEGLTSRFASGNIQRNFL